jgi:aspartyl/asparaginyl beta-hydroxylase (cupin superfamily)
MISIFKLPFTFDPERLKTDLGTFSESDWIPHFNQSYYEGDWSGIPLRAAKDSHLAIYPDPVAEDFEDTELMARCEYVPEVLKKIECKLETVRFLRLGAGAKILEHRDYMLGFENGVARIHIPVQTNPQVEFRLDGEVLQMNEGEAWYLNFNLLHSVNNNGMKTRIHLVIDCLVNDWMREIFEQKQRS